MSKKHKKFHKQEKTVQDPILKVNSEIDALYLKLSQDDDNPRLTNDQISKIKKEISTKQTQLQNLLKAKDNG